MSLDYFRETRLSGSSISASQQTHFLQNQIFPLIQFIIRTPKLHMHGHKQFNLPLIKLSQLGNYLKLKLIHATRKLSTSPPLGSRKDCRCWSWLRMVAAVVLMAGAHEGGDDQQLPQLPFAFSLSLSLSLSLNLLGQNIKVAARAASFGRYSRGAALTHLLSDATMKVRCSCGLICEVE